MTVIFIQKHTYFAKNFTDRSGSMTALNNKSDIARLIIKGVVQWFLIGLCNRSAQIVTKLEAVPKNESSAALEPAILVNMSLKTKASWEALQFSVYSSILNRDTDLSISHVLSKVQDIIDFCRMIRFRGSGAGCVLKVCNCACNFRRMKEKQLENWGKLIELDAIYTFIYVGFAHSIFDSVHCPWDFLEIGD